MTSYYRPACSLLLLLALIASACGGSPSPHEEFVREYVDIEMSGSGGAALLLCNQPNNQGRAIARSKYEQVLLIADDEMPVPDWSDTMQALPWDLIDPETFDIEQATDWHMGYLAKWCAG